MSVCFLLVDLYQSEVYYVPKSDLKQILKRIVLITCKNYFYEKGSNYCCDHLLVRSEF